MVQAQYCLHRVGAQLVAKCNRRGTSFASHEPPIGGEIVALQGVACDVFLLERDLHRQPRAYTEIHAAAYSNMICRGKASSNLVRFIREIVQLRR
jgi:hypothetical protein